jgi:hypothetical protein
MRINSSSINKKRPISKLNIIKGIIPNNYKDFNPVINDEFDTINDWEQLRGTWITSSGNVSTSTAPSSYPILSSLDLRSHDITATMSLDAGGVGVVFWLTDVNNWWAGVTRYSFTTETFDTGQDSCVEVGNARCWGWDGTRAWGCSRSVCTDIFSTRTRYNYSIVLLKSENGVISEVTNVIPNSSLLANDNINGIQISTLGDTITIRARDNANNFYGTSISYNAPTPNKGYRSGIIYTPSTYLPSSSVGNISITGV